MEIKLASSITIPGQLLVAVSEWEKIFIACKQDLFDHGFTEARWPLESVAADEADWEEGEHFFDDSSTGEKKLLCLVEMVKRGEIRSCGVRRAMAYVASHPDIQLDHPLVVPVPALVSGDVLCLPAFLRYLEVSGGSKVDLCPVSSAFLRQCGWLVLRKRRP